MTEGRSNTGLSAGEFFVKAERKEVTDANYTLNVTATMVTSVPPADVLEILSTRRCTWVR